MSKGQIAKARIPAEVEFDCALPQGLVNLWYSRIASGADALLRHCIVIYPPGDFIGQVLDLVTEESSTPYPVKALDSIYTRPQPIRASRIDYPLRPSTGRPASRLTGSIRPSSR